MKLFLIFSHSLTEEQEKEVRSVLGAGEIVSLPERLQKVWSQIPPEGELDAGVAALFTGWLREGAAEGDYALIQGDFGMTFALADWCLREGVVPVYSTTRRVHEESRDGEGNVVSRHVFKHVGFRRYKRLEGE